MRLVLSILLIAAIIGGWRHTSAQAPQSKSSDAKTKLYTDEEIRKLAKHDIDKETGGDKGLFGVPCLDVVPAGKSYARSKVFKTLKIEDARIRDFRHSQINFVVFLTWQVSPSYDICCMSATNDRDNDGLELADPKRKVYGIRLLKRAKYGAPPNQVLHHDRGRILVSRDTAPLQWPRRVNFCVPAWGRESLIPRKSLPPRKRRDKTQRRVRYQSVSTRNFYPKRRCAMSKKKDIQKDDLVGKTAAIRDHDHDMIHDLSKRLDAVWRYDQYIENAQKFPELQRFWEESKQMELKTIERLKELIREHVRQDNF